MNIKNSKHLIRQHLCKWHNHRRTKVWAAIRYNCGECFGHWNLPFDSYDLEALDRLAQGGESFDFAQDREPVERLVEPFEI